MAEIEDRAQERLQQFIRDLREQRGTPGSPLTMEALGDQLGVTATTVEKLTKGIASRRPKTVQMADRGGIPRTEFLWASGYIPDPIDFAHDEARYGPTSQTESVRAMIAGYGRLVIDLEARLRRPASLPTDGERSEALVDLVAHYGGNLAILLDREVPCIDGPLQSGEIVIARTTEGGTDQQFGPLLIVQTPGHLFCTRLMGIERESLLFQSTDDIPARVPRAEVTLIAQVRAIVRTPPS